MLETRVDHPIILGIVGDSASGKTTLTRGIAQILGPDRVTTICSDDYHRYSRAQRAELGTSALNPAANYVDILEEHLVQLRHGRPILKPVYDHAAGTLAPPQYVEPRPYIIVEGLLGYVTRRLRDNYDVKIYLEPDEELRVRWKIQRDKAVRGYTRAQVLRSLERRKGDSPAFIHPQRTYADIVVKFFPPTDSVFESGGHLNVRQILRPTLPHPDLTLPLNGGANSGLLLELARDTDGKPVDVLELQGNLSDARAERLEDWLWGLIPEAGHLRTNVGKFTDEQNRSLMSHPLALTQLMIAFHMIKAALGVHAV